MKAVLISIQPKWVAKITSGEKTIEVRKTKPKLQTPFKVYIYCTKIKNGFLKTRKGVEELGNPEYRIDGKVIGEFVCDRIDEYANGEIALSHNTDETCLTNCELADYIEGSKAYFWHISQLKIYDKPKELSEFGYPCPKGFNDETNYACYREFGDGRLKFCKYNRGERCDCGIKKPPQSWCYVEELQNG